nr:ribonuclease H-like domain-containing protein [Tanacetum cinerariifolium]
MYDEYNALVKNGTWIVVPRPVDANLVRSMWLFKHKFDVDGTLSRYKDRIVANSSSQQLRVDFDETFSLVVKSATIHTVLSLAVSRQWPIHQLDVKNAFLNCDLSETAPRAWFLWFAGYATQAGFSPSRCDSSLFIYTQEFDMTDLGALNYFLGISAVRHPTWLFLSHKKYDLQLIERAHMANCNLSRTPVDTDSKLGPDGVHGTLEFGLHLYAFATTSLVGYTDADWVGFLSTRRSTSGYCVFLGDNLLSWSAKRQHTISRSSTEEEYRATLVYCDNVSAVYMSTNLVQHQRTKHIEIDIHFVRDMVRADHVRVLHFPSRFQYADIFTKGLPSALFEDFRSSFSVRPPSAQTAGWY